MAEGGWPGITMPQRHGRAGLGVTEAAPTMHAIAQHGGGMAAASSLHVNMLGPHPIVVHGTPEQQARWTPPLVAGTDQACFGFTEPNAGLDATSITTLARRVPGGNRVNGRKIWASTAQVAAKVMLPTRTSRREEARRPTEGITLFYADLDRTQVEVLRIPKMGRAAVESNMLFIDDLFVPEEDGIGEEDRGFACVLDSLNPERVLAAAEAIAIGQDVLDHAAHSARERTVFGRPIGQDQTIQHPLAECWTGSEEAAWLYDSGRPCAAEADAAKLLGGRAGYQARLQAVLPHGGMGYAKKYVVERLLREVTITRIAQAANLPEE